jgi:lipopolysaccharide/colanic/teichoic acid biosynthesis glycosyltransferase
MSELQEVRQILREKMSEVSRTIVFISSSHEDTVSFKEYFSKKDFNIKSFKDPIEAFYWIKNNTTDLIICDVDLSNISGISLLRKIKLHKNISDIPFILTSSSVILYIPDARKAKANDLYQKPLDFDRLFKRIKHLSKIRLHQDDNFKMIQDTWSKKIKAGLFKKITSSVIAAFLLLILSPIFILLYFYSKTQHVKKPLKTVEKIGAGYDILKLYEFEFPNTEIGLWLTNHNFNKWPELLNVLIGNISIIGNKALPLVEAKMYTSDKYSIRFLAPTGLTGERHFYDIKKNKSIQAACLLENNYAMNRSFFKDILIFFKSIFYIFKKSNHIYYDL